MHSEARSNVSGHPWPRQQRRQLSRVSVNNAKHIKRAQQEAITKEGGPLHLNMNLFVATALLPLFFRVLLSPCHSRSVIILDASVCVFVFAMRGLSQVKPSPPTLLPLAPSGCGACPCVEQEPAKNICLQLRLDCLGDQAVVCCHLDQTVSTLTELSLQMRRASHVGGKQCWCMFHLHLFRMLCVLVLTCCCVCVCSSYAVPIP